MVEGLIFSKAAARGTLPPQAAMVLDQEDFGSLGVTGWQGRKRHRRAGLGEKECFPIPAQEKHEVGFRTNPAGMNIRACKRRSGLRRHCGSSEYGAIYSSRRGVPPGE